MANIHCKTFGCANNFAESEIMQGFLAKAGHTASSEEKADIILLNLCTVKGDINAIKEAQAIHKAHPETPLILGGCLLKETIDKLTDIPNVSILNTYNIDKITEIVEHALEGKQTQTTHYHNFTKVNQPRVRDNPNIAIIPISSGCLSRCSYCSVKRIKGNLISFPEEAILADAKKAITDGCKELWLTSQDNGCYGFDKETNLAKLTKKIASLDGDFKIRLGMASPQHLMQFSDELIQVLQHDKVFRFIHIPIQSGNDQVLKDMSREHTVQEFKDLVKKLRTVKDITITTDIICGYPTETDEQFQDTIALLNDIRFDAVNISRFQVREYTPAAKLKQLHGRFSKERSRLATEAYKVNAEKRNKTYVGQTQEVLITEKGKENSWVARNASYKPVILHGNCIIGQKVTVKVTEATAYDLRATEV